VAAPEPDALREASYFVQRLEAEQMPLAGLVLNRVQQVRLPELTAATARAGAERLDGEHSLVAELLRLHADRMETAARQTHLARSFTGAHPRVPVATVIALADDVHDLDGLTEVGDLLAQD
jgi:anion-transporting  ArsA/GET3 family ATPase